jgi:hypothetical protein
MNTKKPTASFTAYEAAKILRRPRKRTEEFFSVLADCLEEKRRFRSGPSAPKRRIWGKRYAQYTDTKVKDQMLALLASRAASNRADAYKKTSHGYIFLPETLRKFNALVRFAGATPRKT